MNPKYDIYEEIDRYLIKQLSEGELVIFTTKLKNDPSLQELVDAQKLANEIIIDHELVKLKERMRQDLRQGGSENTSNWGKIILLTVAVSSTALYSYTQFSNPSEQSSIKEESIKNTSSLPETTENTLLAVTTDNKHTAFTKTNTTEENQAIISTEQESSSLAIENKVEQTTSTHLQNKNAVKSDLTEQKAYVLEHSPVISCETVKITADVSVDYGHQNYEDATIIVQKQTVKGGTAPYSYSLDEAAFEKENRFDGLKDGVYHVSIKDYNNCVSKITKNIVVKIPVKEIDEAFTPSNGERWKFPIPDHADGTITIINKAGTTVYSQNIVGGYPSDWDGRGNNGTALDLGNYYFMVTFKDNTINKGHISIVQ